MAFLNGSKHDASRTTAMIADLCNRRLLCTETAATSARTRRRDTHPTTPHRPASSVPDSRATTAATHVRASHVNAIGGANNAHVRERLLLVPSFADARIGNFPERRCRVSESLQIIRSDACGAVWTRAQIRPALLRVKMSSRIPPKSASGPIARDGKRVSELRKRWWRGQEIQRATGRSSPLARSRHHHHFVGPARTLRAPLESFPMPSMPS